jgi:hypothetical protein
MMPKLNTFPSHTYYEGRPGLIGAELAGLPTPIQFKKRFIMFKVLFAKVNQIYTILTTSSFERESILNAWDQNTAIFNKVSNIIREQPDNNEMKNLLVNLTESRNKFRKELFLLGYVKGE